MDYMRHRNRLPPRELSLNRVVWIICLVVRSLIFAFFILVIISPAGTPVLSIGEAKFNVTLSNGSLAEQQVNVSRDLTTR